MLLVEREENKWEDVRTADGREVNIRQRVIGKAVDDKDKEESKSSSPHVPQPFSGNGLCGTEILELVEVHKEDCVFHWEKLEA